MSAKDCLIFVIVLVSTCLIFVHSSIIRPEFLSPTEPPTALPYEMSPEHLYTHLEIEDMQNVPDYEIVSPLHIKGSRRKRDALTPRDKVEVRLTAFGEEFWLVLTHNDKLLSADCVIEEHDDDKIIKTPCVKTKENENDTTLDDDCFYHGYSRNHNNSIISMALCSGLHGIISVPQRDHDFIIKPIKEDHVLRTVRSTTPSNPHVIYRKRRQAAFDTWQEPAIKFGPHKTSRRKRASGGLYMEIMLAADKPMWDSYGNGLRNHLLLNANFAATRLSDISLGRQIRLTVVWILIDKGTRGIKVNPDVDISLPEFCSWAEERIPEESHKRHFDTSALFTKVDLEARGNKNVIGYAPVGGVCHPRYRCTINQDTSLSTGFTLAHELGHNIGIGHDSAGNTCQNGRHIMGTSGGPETDSYKWSPCSKKAFTNYLQSPDYKGCMDERPSFKIPLPKDLPGVTFNGDRQCTIWLGDGWTQYTSDEEFVCQWLACQTRHPSNPWYIDIKYKYTAVLDGTSCENSKKHCMRGKCVDKT